MKKESNSKKYNNNESIIIDYFMLYLFEDEEKNYSTFIQFQNDRIKIKYDNYLVSLDKNDLSLLTKNNFETIEDAFKYIKKFTLADTKRNIIKNKEITIKIFMDLEDGKEIELKLLYDKNEEKKIIY